VVDVALAIVDEAGGDALTLARVAERTGVAPPSLYKHVDGLAGLRRQVRLRVLEEFGEALREATMGRSGPDALRAMAVAYRDYLCAHPQRYRFIEIAPGHPETTAAVDRVVEVIFAALRGYGMSRAELVHAIRCVRAAVHGFTHLEALGGFGLPEDVDVSFDHLLDMITDGVAAMSAGSSSTPPPSTPAASTPAAPTPTAPAPAEGAVPVADARPEPSGQGSTTRARK
jgi:AcrR family transcriptional regulator